MSTSFHAVEDAVIALIDAKRADQKRRAQERALALYALEKAGVLRQHA